MDLDGIIEIKDEPEDEEDDFMSGLGLEEESCIRPEESCVITVEPYFNDTDVASAFSKSEEDPLAAPKRLSVRKTAVSLNGRKKGTGSKKMFSCSACNFRGATHSILTKHMLTHTGKSKFSCEFCDYTSTIFINVETHMLTQHNEPRYACDICDFKCVLLSTIKAHMRRHTQDPQEGQQGRHLLDKPYSCQICEFRAKNKYSLKQHMVMHTNGKPFACGHCDFATCTKSSLMRHMRTKHPSVETLSCEMCDFKCRSMKVLETHLEKHAEPKADFVYEPVTSKERIYSCQKCDFKTKVRTAFESHKRSVHFPCKVCDFKTSSLADLNQHLLSHGNAFACDVCVSKFDTARALRIHRNDYHSSVDLEPLACKFCDYRCSDVDSLIEHSEAHSGR